MMYRVITSLSWRSGWDVASQMLRMWAASTRNVSTMIIVPVGDYEDFWAGWSACVSVSKYEYAFHVVDGVDGFVCVQVDMVIRSGVGRT